ncbi:MAG: hypothetical protein II987_02245 [Clostridia bacterium]|nr:hypothetical protein [Clostridia bacterium]
MGNELLQCEFTNELRNHREEIQIICNHIAVEIRPYFLFRPGGIQSAVGRVSERLFRSFADAGDALFAISTADLIFRPENTVNTYACNRAYCPIFRDGNEHRLFSFLPQTTADANVRGNGYRNDALWYCR